jgi:tRNA-splicing ligase RtcB
MPQLGTLGSGNHFLEIGYVEEVFDPGSAEIFGLERGEVSVLIHTGSRGAGHQICTDSLQILEGSSKKYGIDVPDRQLACAPVGTEEAEDYYGAMCTAANYAWANRQIITHWIRVAFKKILKVEEEDLKLVYDVAHNIAKVEEHEVEGKMKKLYVHRKGATRAFPPGSKDIPDGYRGVGQPVFIPGSMGTYSYVLKGTEIAMKETFGTTCHGAGRVISRGRAKRTYTGRKVREELKKMGITVKVAKDSILAEEAPQVYKLSDDIVEVVDRVGISKKVARLKPLGVVKG